MQKMHIDLSKESLTADENLVLAKLIQQFLRGKGQTKLSKHSTFTLSDKSLEVDNSLEVTLSHGILKVKYHPQKNQPKDSYLVIDNKVIGRGDFGKAKLSVRQIELGGQNGASLKPNKEERVIKISLVENDKDKQENIEKTQKESSFTRQVYEDVSDMALREEADITRTYFAMPKKGKQDLDTFLKKIHQQPANVEATTNPAEQHKELLLKISLNLIKAVEELHKTKKILHRDIKAANVRIDPNTDEVWLLDFGFSEDLQEKPWETDILEGTPFYMAPEFFDGRRAKERARISKETDYYALGMMLIQVFIGLALPKVNNAKYRKTYIDKYGNQECDGRTKFNFNVFDKKMEELGLKDLASDINKLCGTNLEERSQNFNTVKAKLEGLLATPNAIKREEVLQDLDDSKSQSENIDPTPLSLENKFFTQEEESSLKRFLRTYEKLITLNKEFKEAKKLESELKLELERGVQQKLVEELKLKREEIHELRLKQKWQSTIYINRLAICIVKKEIKEDKLDQFLPQGELPILIEHIEQATKTALEDTFKENLEKTKLDEIRKQDFYKNNPEKRDLFNRYVVDHLTEVIDHQVKVYGLDVEEQNSEEPVSALSVEDLGPKTRARSSSLPPASKPQPSIKRNNSLSDLKQPEIDDTKEQDNKEQMAKQLLKSIQEIILETKWSLGLFGGKTVDVMAENNKVEKTIKISRTHKKVLDAIREAQGAPNSSENTPWLTALKHVIDITHDATQDTKSKKNYSDKVWFFGRSKATQDFYLKLNDAADAVNKIAPCA